MKKITLVPFSETLNMIFLCVIAGLILWAAWPLLSDALWAVLRSRLWSTVALGSITVMIKTLTEG